MLETNKSFDEGSVPGGEANDKSVDESEQLVHSLSNPFRDEIQYRRRSEEPPPY